MEVNSFESYFNFIMLKHYVLNFSAQFVDQSAVRDEIKNDQVYLDKVCADLQKDGFRAHAVLVHGKDPADGILSVAQDEGCDLIAMATHGHHFIEDVILGSVADTLRHRTDIPILMTRASVK